jgi:methylmalonyl-CoA mutase cobalamin-binding subunit
MLGAASAAAAAAVDDNVDAVVVCSVDDAL